MAQGVRINIGADASGVRKGVDDAERSLNRLHTAGRRAMQGIGVAGIAAGAAIGTGLVAAVATGTREMLEQERVSAQTAAALKSTGAQAGITRKEIEGLSSSLQAQTGIADDVIQSNANLLLTFTNIRNEAGRGNDVFNQATKTILDMSVALGQDGKASAIQLGKALNDPIQGVSALREVGVSFTKQQQDQITTMVKSGNTLKAQKMILRELNKEFGGSAAAFGNTTQGQLERIKRAWEDVSQSLVVQFLPIFTRVARGVLANMDKVQAAFNGIRVFANGMVSFVSALFRGKWQEAWNIAAEGAGKALRALGTLATKVLYPMAVKMGRAIASGLAAGLDAGLRSVPGGSAVARFLGLGASGTVNPADYGGNWAAAVRGGRGTVPVDNGGGWSTGGVLPGVYAGVDTMTIRAAPGEIVLTPGQARIVGIDRILGALRATGGRMGGDGFASGGIVGDAYQRATHPPSTKYVYGTWDCSKYATYVAGVGQGGTTMSAYALSSPAKGGEPIVWGFRKSHAGAYRGGKDEHMGVRVNGQWFDNGSGGVQSNADSMRWQEVRVPKGLENLSGTELSDTKSATAGTGRTIGPVETLMRILRKAAPRSTRTRADDLVGAMLTGGERAAAAAPSPLARARELSADNSGIADYSGMDSRGTSLTARQQRTVDTIGRAAAQQARDAGIRDPQEIARRQNEAERNEEIRILRHHVTLINADLKKLHTKKGKNLREIARITKRKGLKPGEKRRLVAAIRLQNRRITAEMDELREVRAEVNARLMEIGEQIAAEADQAAYDAMTAGGEDAAADTAAADTAPTADQQALLDQANARADAASRSAAIGASFVRTILGSGSIDPGSGGLTINFNSLHPGDPQIQAELASWTVGALGGQGSVPATSFASAA